MESLVLSAAAQAQNAAFISQIKNTQTCRDRPLQITQRVGGALTINGYRSISINKLKDIFLTNGKRFTVSFNVEPTVRLDCSEIADSIRYTSINIGNSSNIIIIRDAIAQVTNAEHQSTTTKGAIHSITFCPKSVSMDVLLSILTCGCVLDIVIWPEKLVVNVINQSDNKLGLYNLKSNNPEYFKGAKQCPAKSKTLLRPISRRSRAMKNTKDKKTKGLLQNLFFS